MRRAKSLPYVKIVKAKGRPYAYFETGAKKPDWKPIYKRLPPLDDPSFGAAYGSLLAGRTRRQNVAALLTVPALIDKYERSPEFQELAPNTRAQYTVYLAVIGRELNNAPAQGVERRDFLALRDKLSERFIDRKGRARGGPGAANAMVRTARALFAWGRHREHVTNNPCADVPLFDSKDYPPWPSDLVEAALVHEDAAIRLPIALLYFTAQRIGDVCSMRWGDLRNGTIFVRQDKTDKRLEIRLHRQLADELARAPRTALTILADERGRPLKIDTLRERLQRFAASHGHRVVPHGLRKSAVNALLEAGCSAAETAAISGQSLQMVEHYAKARSTGKLASAAVLKWEAKR